VNGRALPAETICFLFNSQFQRSPFFHHSYSTRR
jgi:hypothetical protein